MHILAFFYIDFKLELEDWRDHTALFIWSLTYIYIYISEMDNYAKKRRLAYFLTFSVIRHKSEDGFFYL